MSGSVGIVGAGLGGLAAACTMAARGHRVTVFEHRSTVGGKAAVLEDAGHRFDMGPTILTLPSVLGRIFAEAGKSLEEYLDLVPLDPQWRSFFSDGSVLDLRSDVESMKAEIERFSGESSSRGYGRFLEYSKQLDEISQRFFFWKSVGSLWDTFDMKGSFQASVLRDVLSLKPGRTVHGIIRQHVPDDRVAQMLDHFTQYVGSAPASSPAVLCGIAHMQTNEGVWYPRGGTRAVPLALERLARELGVEFELGAKVEKLLLDETRRGKRSRACGVRTSDGRELRYDRIVSNADSVRTYRELIGGAIGERFCRRQKAEPACSGVVLYLGLDRGYEHLLHHNFVFSRDAEKEFEEIYRRGEPAADPTCYVCAPARTEPDCAPEGGESLYVLVHTPYLRPHHNWREMLPRYRETILEKLRSTAGLEDIEDRIRVEHTLTPQDIHDRYRVLDGAIYGLASHGRFLGAFKPANRRKDVEGLYLAGGSAHPGPGMPMALMSGWIAADCADVDAREPSPAKGSSPEKASWAAAL